MLKCNLAQCINDIFLLNVEFLDAFIQFEVKGHVTIFGPQAWYKIEGRIDGHLYKSILENFL